MTAYDEIDESAQLTDYYEQTLFLDKNDNKRVKQVDNQEEEVINDNDSWDWNGDPELIIAFEYDESKQEFHFYIRCVKNCPMNLTLIKRSSRAVMYLVKGISKKRSVMGWERRVTWQDITSRDYLKFSTLNVDKCYTTVFNEYFTANVKKKEFNNTLLRIQLCDVDQYNRDIVIAETDYWISSNPINQFNQFEIPFPPYCPDLGEIELNVSYLPTSQRLIVHYCKVTNLKMDNTSKSIYVRGSLFVDNRAREVHKTELRRNVGRNAKSQSDDGVEFRKKLLYDMNRNEVFSSQLLIHVVELEDIEKHVIGQAIIGFNDNDHWKLILKANRDSVSQIHRLTPSAG